MATWLDRVRGMLKDAYTEVVLDNTAEQIMEVFEDYHKKRCAECNGGSMGKPWIGVDLDGTLAEIIKWEGPQDIGRPIEPMVKRVREWLAEGKTVKVFTARAAHPEYLPYVYEWLSAHGLGNLDVTNKKDMFMVELWDDRCIQVEKNTGKIVGDPSIISRNMYAEENGE